MKFYYPDVLSYEIKRRTFEGKDNPDKNNNSLTSKYMPSYKYWMKIEHPNYVSKNCYRTKQDALEALETAKYRAGSSL